MHPETRKPTPDINNVDGYTVKDPRITKEMIIMTQEAGFDPALLDRIVKKADEIEISGVTSNWKIISLGQFVERGDTVGLKQWLASENKFLDNFDNLLAAGKIK